MVSSAGILIGLFVYGWLDQMEIRLTQPQVELEAWAKLGKNVGNVGHNLSCSVKVNMM